MTNMADSKCYSIDYDYLTQFFAREEIERLHHTICNILLEALANPEKPIRQLSVLTTDERERVLYTFNRTGRYLEERWKPLQMNIRGGLPLFSGGKD